MSRKAVQKNIAYDDEKKLFYVSFYYGRDENGKNIIKKKTFKGKREAINALKQFEADKTKGTLVNPREDTFEEFINYWLNNIKSLNCAETTLYGYKNIINKHIIPYLGKIKLQKLSVADLNKYYTMLSTEKKLSNKTIKKHYNLIKDVLNIAVKEDRILKNPMDKIDQIKVIKKEQKVYTKEELSKLLSIVQDTRLEIIVLLASVLGMRREEIAGLKWEYIDFQDKTLKIAEVLTQAGSDYIEKDAKTNNSYRTLHVPDEIIDLLQKIKDNQEKNKQSFGDCYYSEKNYVIAWEDGRPYRPNYISDIFKKVIDDNNLPPIRLHDLRHTFASIANDLGVEMYDISKALGHSDIGTTAKIYTHMFDKTNKRAINKVAESIIKK